MPIPTLIGIPYDAKSSYLRGPARGPAAIRKALEFPSSNTFSESLLDIAAPGMLADAGDVVVSDEAFPIGAVATAVDAVVEAGGLPLALGGDHSVTYPVIRALARHVPDLTILHFDAHNDLYDEYEGDRFSHACPFTRIMEERLAQRLVQVGIRATTAPQLRQIERFDVEVIDMRAWRRGERFALLGPIYVSVDLDVLDPAFAPGLSHREPGGLSTRDLLDAIYSLDVRIAGADVVELNPDRDLQNMTADVAAKVVKELVARMHETARA
jgi:agmatinase